MSASVAPGSPLPGNNVQMAVTGLQQWKRRRDVVSPPARRSVGGATAPISIALHTPPATRQRTVAFVLDGTDLDAKLESFKDQERERKTLIEEEIATKKDHIAEKDAKIAEKRQSK